MVYLTRKLHFCAAHKLYDEALSPEENRETFGDCVNLHGHNYVLEVTFAGDPDSKSGMVIHLSELDAIVRERVIDRLDHKYLNEDVPMFKDAVPTVEMLAKYAWQQLDGSVPGAKLHRIRIDEDNTLLADYYGKGPSMVYLTFAGEFNAIHRLWNDALTAEENRRTFDHCSNLHGHRFRVEVTVATDVSKERPAAIGRSMIRNTVDEVLAPKLRNGNLNEAFGEGFMATGENLVRAIWYMLRPALAGEATLIRVRLVETHKNSFVYYGEEGAPKIFSSTAV